MIFNSIEFALFLPIVFVLYWALNKHLRWQNWFVVLASYFFYGWWDWRFLLLIAFTSFCSWSSGLLIEKSSHPKIWLSLNIIINLLLLCIFKYYNFFVSSFCELFCIENALAIKVILPVGISFYTFQALSYSIDVFRKKIAATTDIVSFFAFVSFFPQLVAGPIERATNLLPQFTQRRTFDYYAAVDGLRRILWGLFKKIVVADNCASYVNLVWDNYPNENATTLIIAAILFSFQIYGDFSGYSDIAIGTARLFGIELKDNFQMPYFSRNVAEFWKRWHISLNTWFVDYVYIPLGGSREGRLKTILNTFVIFLLSGIWHGANWTYIAWGLFHAALFIPLILINRTKAYSGVATWKQLPQIILTFILATIGWIIFRAPSILEAWRFFISSFTQSVGTPLMISGFKRTIISVLTLIGVEWYMRGKKHGLDISHLHWALRISIYYLLIFIILEFGGNSQSFIYFQF